MPCDPEFRERSIVFEEKEVLSLKKKKTCRIKEKEAWVAKREKHRFWKEGQIPIKAPFQYN
jgi:hypothetical protein